MSKQGSHLIEELRQREVSKFDARDLDHLLAFSRLLDIAHVYDSSLLVIKLLRRRFHTPSAHFDSSMCPCPRPSRIFSRPRGGQLFIGTQQEAPCV